jgi:hypothetical protein
MEIASFDDLLRAARAQADPQRLLFVFAGAQLPEDASAEQRAEFEAGVGGELAPLMCVDKAPDELADFAALAAEAAQAGPPWAIMFAGALSGRHGKVPTSEDAAAPLQRMVDAIKEGRIDGLLPFDRHGVPVRLA